MKDRFSTVDVFATIHDIKKFEGLRVTNVYDVDSKTYLIKLHRPNEKSFIMFESGKRIHQTSYEWPKAHFPSSFSMKLRKHINQKRLESAKQLGIDRVVDLCFGWEDRACHVIIELYDRGNVVLTDHEYIILNILRPRTDKDTDVRLFVKEKYPIECARQTAEFPSCDQILNALQSANKGQQLKRVLAPLTQYGPTMIEHALRKHAISPNSQVGGKNDCDEVNVEKIRNALREAEIIFEEIRNNQCSGYITFKTIERTDGTKIETYQEFHPHKFIQFEDQCLKEFSTFSECVDEFFSKMEKQKADMKALGVENEAMKKLNNVIKDQQERIASLQVSQSTKKMLAELIELNNELIDKALLVVRSAIANQLSWDAIEEMCKKASEAGDPVASAIIALNLKSNEMILELKDPYHTDSQPAKVAIDISLSSYQNARKYHTEKKAAVDKEQKTVSASAKALKSAQQKAKEVLETVRAKVEITMKRKVMWFEKFYWFVSSENYLVIGGRNAQQNELIVKRYLRPGDLYVHADVRGASSVVIRNKIGSQDVPPKTLNEAGTMAICYSSAWNAKIISTAWWVYHHQVSRTAPTGEYLVAGSFMIRGKKNYLPACQLLMGFGVMFKLDDDSLERHLAERKVGRNIEDTNDAADLNVEQDLALMDDSDESDSKDSNEDEFPDVQVSLGVLMEKDENLNEEYTIIHIGPTAVQKQQQTAAASEEVEQIEEDEKMDMKKIRPQKIRQRHKAEKIKKKYRDQDDEERELRLMLLGSKPKEKKEKTEKTNIAPKKDVNRRQLNEQKMQVNDQPVQSVAAQHEDDDYVLPEADVAAMDAEETKMLNSLTWKPVPEDTLLYAVAVVAPYQTMHNFKHKVKLTPGTSKRGKAAKSALSLFQQNRLTPPQELNLLKVLAADDQISVNIPGKVRVSAPQLNKK